MYVKLIPGERTGLIHKIIHPSTQESLYPDILYAHPFTEFELEDASLYEEANLQMRQFGSSACLILSYLPEDEKIVRDYAALWSEKMQTQEANCQFNPEEEEDIRKMIMDLQLSTTMERSFLQLLTYYKEVGGELADLFSPFREEYALPVKTKNEGKFLYEQIRNTILG